MVEVQDTPQGIRLTQAFAVADVGIVLDPVNADAQLSGGMLFGLGHAMNCELTYRDHRPIRPISMPTRGCACTRPRRSGPPAGERPLRGLGEPAFRPPPRPWAMRSSPRRACACAICPLPGVRFA
ncbi:molybdopterin cofactor-binding domain-containing protein [Paracoccus marcusii]|uniref:molybdopterin cofactor-binding domain-containing protein n=1 Tax=Paracoccus marcusii TaxID=59779 RepID=UPI002ED472BD